MEFLITDAKLFNGTPKSNVITWKQFAKDMICHEPKQFTFGKWFYDVMKFTRNYLSEEMKAGLVIGFITKSDTQRLLQNCAVGTFLLRFSDSASGK